MLLRKNIYTYYSKKSETKYTKILTVVIFGWWANFYFYVVHVMCITLLTRISNLSPMNIYNLCAKKV